MSGGVCFVDTETTGLDPERHQIWEVALLTPDGKERVWQFHVPDELVCDPFALEVGKYWQRRWNHELIDVASSSAIWSADDAAASRRKHFPNEGLALTAVRMPDWCRYFRDLTAGLHLAGAVVSFDEERLRRLLRSHGVLPRWHYHLVDVEALVAGYLCGDAHAGREIRGDDNEDETEVGLQYRLAASLPWDSNELSRSVGVNPENFDHHTALGDARWAKAIYEAVMGSTPDA